MKELNQETIDNLLCALIELEHQTDRKITPEQYQAIFNLSLVANIPTWVRHYFGRKAADAFPTDSLMG